MMKKKVNVTNWNLATALKKAGLLLLTLCIAYQLTVPSQVLGYSNETSSEVYNLSSATGINAGKVSLSKTKIVRARGTSYKLKVRGTKKKVSWRSSNKKVATVSKNGVVSAKSKGTTYITAKIGSKKLRCKVTVIVPQISKTSTSLIKGQTYKLKVKGSTIKPTWKSSNKKVATVSKNGNITARSKGSTTITAKVAGKTLKCKISVIDPKLSSNKLALTTGKGKTLKVSGTKRTVTWKSSNEKVATVSSNGYVKAKSSGTAIITATIKGKTFTCKVTVSSASTYKLNKSSISVQRDLTYQLSLANAKDIKWSSSNKSVASVNSKGLVTGNMTGTATITATANGKEYTCKVTVVPNKEYRRIEKYIVDGINEKRISMGLKPLIYVTSGLMEQYTEYRLKDLEDKAFEISNANHFSGDGLYSMFLIGLKDSTNRNRILLEHPKFFMNEYTYITVYTTNEYKEYNNIDFMLISKY